MHVLTRRDCSSQNHFSEHASYTQCQKSNLERISAQLLMGTSVPRIWIVHTPRLEASSRRRCAYTMWMLEKYPDYFPASPTTHTRPQNYAGREVCVCGYRKQCQDIQPHCFQGHLTRGVIVYACQTDKGSGHGGVRYVHEAWL